MNNQLTVIGHVGDAPKSVFFPDTGNRVVKFSIAVNEYRKDTDKEEPLWLDVDSWNGLGERVLATITKGREVALIGRLSISKFTKEVDGIKTEVQKPVLKLSSFHLCGAKPKAKKDAAAETATESASAAATEYAPAAASDSAADPATGSASTAAADAAMDAASDAATAPAEPAKLGIRKGRRSA